MMKYLLRLIMFSFVAFCLVITVFLSHDSVVLARDAKIGSDILSFRTSAIEKLVSLSDDIASDARGFSKGTIGAFVLNQYNAPQTEAVSGDIVDLSRMFDEAISSSIEQYEEEQREIARKEAEERARQFDLECRARSKAGRIIIPGLVDLRLVSCSVSRSQDVIDAGNAGRFMFHDMDVIGAHKHLGFSGMKSSVPYETYAYINGERYICVSNFLGHNRGYDLTDWYDNPLTYYDGIVMYTCNENWQNVTFTYWKKG